jgi:hypothetical protein
MICVASWPPMFGIDKSIKRTFSTLVSTSVTITVERTTDIVEVLLDRLKRESAVLDDLGLVTSALEELGRAPG